MTNNTQYIIGIDPGLVNTGWGIIKVKNTNHLQFVCCGTIATKTNDKMANRLCNIHQQLTDICKENFNQNHMVNCAIEDVFVNKNPDSSMRLGQAKGVAMLAMAQMGYEIFEYQNRIVKKSIVGSGSATKQQIQAMVGILLNGAQFDTEHSADALAIAITHSQVNAYNKMVNKVK